MKIYIEKDDKSLNKKFKEDITGKELFETLKINSSSVILVKNDEVVLEDEILLDTDEIKILSVISGG
jgi:sulfur carrier protein ThiS